MPQIQLLLGHIELLSITQRTLTIPLSTKSKTSELGLCGVHKFAEIFLNYALWYTSCLRPIRRKSQPLLTKYTEVQPKSRSITEDDAQVER